MRELAGMTGCLIVDGPTIAKWQHKALKNAVDRGFRVNTVLRCENTEVVRNLQKHFGYYALVGITRHGRRQQPTPWSDLVAEDVEVLDFQADRDGAWQRLPTSVAKWVEQGRPDVVIKFGMGLLKGASDLAVPGGVLSYHHGDPARYRGRPAGFWELVEGADAIGAMVQQIGDRLDAGRVVAIGHSKVLPHSYRGTLDRAYDNSAHLLAKALVNVRNGVVLDWPTDGKNCRLPRNRVVAGFVTRLVIRKLRRLLYGATTEKAWRVAIAEPIEIGGHRAQYSLQLSEAESIGPPSGCSIVADPVPSHRGLLCEAVDRRSGRGTIWRWADGRWSRVDTSLLGHGHLSYPFSLEVGSETFVLPEMAQVGPQVMAQLQNDRVIAATTLKGLEAERLVDPTVVARDGRWWLFAGRPGSAAELLFLWSADDVQGPYVAHPANPIVMDPGCARMAGGFLEADGQLCRIGQDNSGSYGNGVVVSRVTMLDRSGYVEQKVMRIDVQGASGPHTLAMDGQQLCFDYYVDRRSIGAGMRRLAAVVGRVSARTARS